MKLLVTQLAEGENAFRFSSEKDGWLADVVTHVRAKGYDVKSNLDVDANLTKLEPDYYLRGQMRFEIEQTCARCAENFVLPIRHAFEVALAHVSTAKVSRDALSEESEELDVNFFEGPEIDLGPIVQEQFFLSLPYQSLCRPGCRGVCQRCGKNLNGGECGCSKASPLSPFSVLQDLKV